MQPEPLTYLYVPTASHLTPGVYVHARELAAALRRQVEREDADAFQEMIDRADDLCLAANEREPLPPP